MSAPLAHIGHWTTSLMYVAPVAIIVVALWWLGVRDRRRDAAGEPPDEPTPGAHEGEPDVVPAYRDERQEPPVGKGG